MYIKSYITTYFYIKYKIYITFSKLVFINNIKFNTKKLKTCVKCLPYYLIPTSVAKVA